MGDQPRWPAGTPTGPGNKGPGGGRWRGDTGSVADRIRGIGQTQAIRESVLAALHPNRPSLRPISVGSKVVEAHDDRHSEDFGVINQYDENNRISETGGRFLAITPHLRSQGGVEDELQHGQWFDNEIEATLFLWEYGRTERGRRERYNADILAEAWAAENANLNDEDPEMTDEAYGADDELEAQIELVEKLRDRQVAPGAMLPLPDGTLVPGTDPRAWDAAVDHLRGMLEISYLDRWELPEPPP